jgi:hypothetical protein
MTAGASICVLGAGPAGCVAAYRLATLGHSVTLLARAKAGRHPMGETLPVSAAKLLEGIGLGHVVEMAAYRLATEGLSLWDSETPAAHPSPAILLRRDRFDALLRRAAEGEGVRVVEAAAGARPTRRPGGGWRATLGAAGEGCVDADFLVDARGRRGGRPLGAATVALAACWCDASPLPAATCVEATTDGWAWGGAAPDGRHAAACFVDPERVGGLDIAGRLALYSELIAGMRLLRPLLDGQICAPPVTIDATAYVRENLAESDRVPVGDAAVATEPLSSQGIQGAIISAIQGAAAAHTVLTRPEDALLALEFHRTSRLAAARVATRHATSHHTAALRRFQTSFWRRRAISGDVAPSFPQTTRVSLDAPVRLSPSARVRDGAVLDGYLIRRCRVLDYPALDQPTAYLGSVELAPLLEASCFPASQYDILRAWSAQVGAHSARVVLAWLCSLGVLAVA